MNHFNAVYRRPVLQSCMTSVPAESVLRPLKRSRNSEEALGEFWCVVLCIARRQRLWWCRMLYKKDPHNHTYRVQTTGQGGSNYHFLSLSSSSH